MTEKEINYIYSTADPATTKEINDFSLLLHGRFFFNLSTADKLDLLQTYDVLKEDQPCIT